MTNYKIEKITHIEAALQKAQDDFIYLDMINSILSQEYFWSYTLDLTRSCQSWVDNNEPLWKQADDRFFWNKFLLQPVINACNSKQDVV